MDKNLNIIAKELFNKIRTSFPKIKIGDENSQVTDQPEMARFFSFDYTQDGEILGSVNISLSSDDGLVVIYSANLVSDKSDYTKKQFYAFLKELREFAKQKLLTFDTRDISKSNLEKRDFKQLSNNIGEGNMTESKLFGTSKTSYQQLGDSKLIVKHSAPVNYDNPAGRTQRIDSIYIENAQGERFRYPFKHLNGARALAQHVSHGGTPYDTIGEHVIGLSEELSKLRMFKHYVDRNSGLSEAMGTIHSKVMERIDAVKKEIFDLQHPARYETFAENFESPNVVAIPEEIMNDWVDRLTIRTFNEELKNVFPYIFKLVDESDIPVKELGIDDLLVSEDQETEEYAGTSDIAEFAEYESYLNQIVGEATDIFSNNEATQGEAIAKLNQLISQEFPVGPDGSNAVEALTGIINDDELMDIFKELADVNPEADVRDILKDYITLKDEENGTDVMSKVSFDASSAGMDGAPEPAPVEEPAAAPAEEPAAEPAPVTADIWGEGKEEKFDPLKHVKNPTKGEKTAAKDVKRGSYADRAAMLKSAEKDGRLKEADDEDLPWHVDPKDKKSKDVTPGKHGQGYSKARHLARQGMQNAIKKAKKAGATAETMIRIAGQEMSLGEAMVKAGMKVEDVFGNKSDELIEFVKSMYNTEEGSFPKGETGVLIACEKKFGEGSVPLAQKVVEKLTNLGEMTRMKKMAGLHR